MGRFAGNDIISLVGGAPRYDLAESYGPDIAAADLVDPSRWAEIGRLALGYGTAPGKAALRAAIARHHGVGADDVVVTVGGAQALFLSAFILCGPGDEAVTTAPVFPHTRNALEAVGATVHILPATFDTRYQPDLEQFRGLLSARTKLVTIASPQNPSGVALPQATLRAMLATMAEICPDAHLLVDETYRDASYGNDQPAPTLAGLSPKVITTASLSKCHGAPGLRIGWAITTDADLRQQFVLGKFNTSIACSPLDEALALHVMEQHDRLIAARRPRLTEGLRLTGEWAARNAGFVDWVRPDAGALCCIRLKPAVFDAAGIDRFRQFGHAAGVRLAEGPWFDDEPGVFRLGFGLLAGSDYAAALGILSDVVRRAAG